MEIKKENAIDLELLEEMFDAFKKQGGFVFIIVKEADGKWARVTAQRANFDPVQIIALLDAQKQEMIGEFLKRREGLIGRKD